MSAFLSRFTSLFSYRCFERRILLDFAALRCGLVALGVVALYLWQERILGAGPAIVLIPCNGAFIALVSADWIEHYGRMLALGYSYLPTVSAIGELEGSNCPTDKEAEAGWRATMFTRIFPGDDPGAGHYPYPVIGFWNRVRAIFTGLVLVLVLAGCARTPPYLCVAGRLESGAPAMLCTPYQESTP